MSRTITAANSVFTLLVAGVFPAPRNIEQYAADDQFSVDSVDVAETLMGVDGVMSAGWVPAIIPMQVMLQANSPSVDLFEQWDGAQAVAREIITAVATIILPSVDKSFVLTNGVLKQVKRFPDGKRTLQPIPYMIHWGSVVSTPLTT